MKILLATLLVAALAGVAAGRSDSQAGGGDTNGVLAAAIVGAGQDVRDSTAELNRIREESAAESAPLAARLDALSAGVAELRERVAGIRRERNRRADEYESAERRAAALDEQYRFARSLLVEYRRSLETRASRAEALNLSAGLAGVDRALERVDAGTVDLPEAAERVLALAGSWNADRFGGVVFDGMALDGQGVEHAGKFAVLGPLVYFAPADSAPAGLGTVRLGSSQVSVFSELKDADAAAVRALVLGGPAAVPVDVTSGDALKLVRVRGAWLAHLRKGGVVMIPLAAVGILGLVLIVMKLVELGRCHVGPDPAVDEVMRLLAAGDDDGAGAVAAGMGAPLSDVIAGIVERRGTPREDVEEAAHGQILTLAHVLERHLGMIAVLGGVAPLLGLLGTVTGMIHTFKLVTIFGTGDAKLLSGGISEALVTTEAGLIIAIPVLIVHAYLLRRVRAMVAHLEQAASEVTGRI